MEEHLEVYRIGRGRPLLIGRLTHRSGAFIYDAGYLANPDARPISLSLPLREAPFDGEKARPYFEGLVPEGRAREILAARLHVRETDYLSLLAAAGLDCVGDIAVCADGALEPPSYEPLPADELPALFHRRESMAELNGTDRLSIAGTQSKVGLAHAPSGGLDDGWFRAKGSAATTHILKANASDNVSYLEYLCMNAASLCGLRAASTALLDFGMPVICSERFDRIVEPSSETPGFSVVRLHQEDLAQAFGVASSSKYAELEGGSFASLAQLIVANVDEPARDLQELARLICFNFLIGNCDDHLKNVSILYGEDWAGCSLAPAYDLVCTTWFPDLSRDMGAAIGGVWNIDAVWEENLRECAREIGVGKRLFAEIAHDIAERIEDAVGEAAAAAPAAFDEVGWKADELLDDMAPRKLVLARV